MSVTAPKGFSAAGATAGVKASGKPDLALVVNHGPEYVAAGVFTRNQITAAPVQLTRTNLRDHTLRAVVLNSGNANACTGAPGVRDARAITEAVARSIGVRNGDVGCCSTGLIGERLPMRPILSRIGALAGALDTSSAAGEAAAEAILTTDTCVKQTLQSGAGWQVGGMGKGVGMISPSLATMLVALTTDARVAAEALRAATATTFDRLDIDGTTSTNDTVLLLASGASGVQPDPADFAAAVRAACEDLAVQMQADAEGGYQARDHRGERRGHGRRGGGRRPDHRPGQPGQVRALWVGPELGPRPGGRRYGPGQHGAGKYPCEL